MSNFKFCDDNRYTTVAALDNPVFTKPSGSLTFHNANGEEVGRLSFDGLEMVFTGHADESAKIFFDYLKLRFKIRDN